MKLLIGFLILLPAFVYAQLPERNDEKCYDKARRVNVRINGIECGKVAGIVDCNEKLTFDENTNLILSGNDGSPFSGTCETCFSHGLLERRITFVNGREEGSDTTYFRSGCRQVVRNHLGGEEHGQWMLYYDSLDQLAWEINYLVGDKHGKSIFFTKDGDTTLWENYSKGLLNGTKWVYYPESIIKKEINYLAGRLNGSYKYWSDDSTLLENLNFKNGQKDGVLKYYFNDGTLLKVENWDEGVKNGEFKTFYYQGHVQTQENYKKGLKEGEFLEYFPSQTMKRRHVYKKDVLLEDHVYNENGEETYSFGKPTEIIKGNEDDNVPGVLTDKPKKSKKRWCKFWKKAE